MSDLCDYELQVLGAFANGAVDDLQQGAALNQAAAFLMSSGYMNKVGDVSKKGADALGYSHPVISSPQTRGGRSETKEGNDNA